MAEATASKAHQVDERTCSRRRMRRSMLQHQRHSNGHRKNRGDHHERLQRRDHNPVRRQHLCRGKREHRRQAVVQVGQLAERVGQHKEERPQTHHGEDVGRVRDEGVLRD